MDEIAAITTDDVLEALRLWHGGKTDKWPLAKLRLGLILAVDEEIYGSFAGTGPGAKNRAVLNRGLEEMRLFHPDAEDLLRERFEQRREVTFVANRLNITDGGLYYRQKQAIQYLADTLTRLEADANRNWQERMIARLELPTYTDLIGVETLKNKLVQALISEEDFFILALDGLGGLGKTALADYVVRGLTKTNHFDEIAWVTAKHMHLSATGRLQIDTGRPALTFPMLVDRLATQFELQNAHGTSHIQKQRNVMRYLQERACLVVIDNLETVADYRSLLPELRRWRKPSKFLLTSRMRLLDEPDVFSMSLHELPAGAAFQLLRTEAQRTGFSALAEADDEEIRQIYELVGGNPLALKLVVGQLRFRSLPRVLDRFSKVSKDQPQEGLFDYIFQDAWQLLGDESKTTLLALTQAGETGFTFEHIVDVSGLPEAVVDQSLEKLVLLSLVDLTGKLTERRYRLHRLTEVFLLKILDGS